MESRLNRFSPLTLRSGKTLRNRVVVPPMASATADTRGGVTTKTIEHYRRLAASGAALVMVEYTFVDRSGRSEGNQLGLYEDAQIAAIQHLAQVIHKAGALAGIQLTHAGAKSSRDLTGGALQSPSGIAVPVKDQILETPDPMSSRDLVEWKNAFSRATNRSVQAGFDLVEFHAAHGYGLNQWLSPITNQRADEYGGSLENRCRLLLEIVEQARASHPALLLAVRMPGQDFMEGGLTAKDGILLAQALENRGLDVIDVSSGIGGWRRPIERRGEGYLVAEAKLIQSHVTLPVIGVGGIEHGEFIDQAVASHTFSLAAVGRALLKEPSAWGIKHLNQPRSFNAAHHHSCL